MIKGYKHYFSMFGMMLFTANLWLQKLFNSINTQIAKSVDITIDCNAILLQETFQKHRQQHKIK